MKLTGVVACFVDIRPGVKTKFLHIMGHHRSRPRGKKGAAAKLRQLRPSLNLAVWFAGKLHDNTRTGRILTNSHLWRYNTQKRTAWPAIGRLQLLLNLAVPLCSCPRRQLHHSKRFLRPHPWPVASGAGSAPGPRKCGSGSPGRFKSPSLTSSAVCRAVHPLRPALQRFP
jgi:hypothetical protein